MVSQKSLPLQSQSREIEGHAEVAQLVEHNLAKVRVAGSSPVFRSCFQIKPRNSSELRGFLFIVFSSEKHAYVLIISCLCFHHFMPMFFLKDNGVIIISLYI